MFILRRYEVFFKKHQDALKKYKFYLLMFHFVTPSVRIPHACGNKTKRISLTIETRFVPQIIILRCPSRRSGRKIIHYNFNTLCRVQNAQNGTGWTLLLHALPLLMLYHQIQVHQLLNLNRKSDSLCLPFPPSEILVYYILFSYSSNFLFNNNLLCLTIAQTHDINTLTQIITTSTRSIVIF